MGVAEPLATLRDASLRAAPQGEVLLFQSMNLILRRREAPSRRMDKGDALYLYPTAWAIGQKSVAFRLAPPTRAPSTLATAMSSAAFEPLTEPP